MEFEVDHEEADEEMEISAGEAAAGPPGWESSSAGAGGATTSSAAGRSSGPPTPKGGGFRYRECQKNHAVGIGGHAVDGCCEFMAAGDEGSLDALKCAACNCHRNFHRRDPLSASAAGTGTTRQAQAAFHAPPPLPPHHHFPSAAAAYYRTPAPPPSGPSGYLHVRPLALPGTDGGEDLVSNPSSSGGGGGGGRGGGGGSSSSKKRFRTKFSQDQKERMLEFAERVGWRIQKHDEAAVEQFCSETGVRRQVLKVWMHNNKHTLGKKP